MGSIPVRVTSEKHAVYACFFVFLLTFSAFCDIISLDGREGRVVSDVPSGGCFVGASDACVMPSAFILSGPPISADEG